MKIALSKIRSYFGISAILCITVTLSLMALIQLHLGLIQHVRQLVRLWSRAVLKVMGIKIIVIGAENIPANRAVFAVSHTSLADTFIYPAILPVNTCYIGKQELKRLPLVSRCYVRLGHIFVNRTASREAVRKFFADLDAIEGTRPIFIHPEGTRSLTGEIGRFKRGVARIALRHNLPIVPIVSQGGQVLWPKGQLYPTRGTIAVVIGSPMSSGPNKNEKEFAGRIRSTMQTLIATVQPRSQNI